MRFIYFQLILLFFLINRATAQNYLWPTDASPYLSSSFCEYRPGHFHSAIDIKTWNREGYKCFAVADGRIDHIRISPFGGGKALYIRLNDGRMAVYYHLSRFPKNIESEIRKLQLRKKKFRVEWWPKNRFVKRGQIVAYTGQSGIGVPHLHFEIRDPKNHPLNPLRFYPKVKDTIAPLLQELMVIPQNSESKSGLSFLPRRIKLIREKNNHYRLAGPVYAKGRIGLALRGFDRGNGVGNKLNFYAATLFLNRKPVFHMAYDRLSFSKTAQADVEVYYPERIRSHRQFHKLYVDPYNTLDFYDRSFGNGIINVKEDVQPFRITVRDFKGNTSIVEGNIVPFTPRPGRLRQVTKLDSNAYIRLILPDSLKFIRFSSGRTLEKLFPVNYFEIIDRHVEQQGISVLIKLVLHNPADHFLQVTYQKDHLPPVTTIAPLDNGQPVHSSPKIRLMDAGKNIVLRVDDVVGASALHFKVGDGLGMDDYPLSVFNNQAEAVLPARDISGPVRFYVANNDSVLLDTLVNYQVLYPDSIQSISLFRDSIRIKSDFAPYDTLLVSVRKEHQDSTDFNLPVYGPVYDFSPRNQILRKRLKIYFKSGPEFMNGKHTAIYALDKNNGLHFNGGRYDSLSGFITLRTKSLGRYIIAADTVAPELKIISPRSGRHYKHFPAIRFKVDDAVSGIGIPENITVYLDGRFIISEWDPERKLVTARPDYRPARGRHLLRIIVQDQSGNRREVELSFFLK